MASGYHDMLAFLFGWKSAVQQGSVVTVAAKDIYVGGGVTRDVYVGGSVTTDVYVGGGAVTEVPD